MRSFYQLLTSIGTSLQPLLLLVMRLYWGFSFYETGMGKFHNHDQVAQYFQSMNIALPALTAYVVAFFETVGGLCLAFGFASRLMCVPLIVILCTAYATAHHEALVHIFSDPETFISQAPFNFLLTTLIVFCFGPGSLSIDRLFEQKKNGYHW